MVVKPQDRDDNPFKLSPRFKNKTIVTKREPRHCFDFVEVYAYCLNVNDFEISKCANQLKELEKCNKDMTQPRRESSFNYHLQRVIKNKYRIPI
ncbi:putative mitochondrial protein [Heterostelium album PN500]|uniref:Putative mitochondrial protein n=1 Tax=Heterostelium pallidum (strain ATCC 26659 / Pp 5 / PN500) TaxID=670386 RepID=D3BH92_HETP5|nr:putative mitochondrial protein [Heterostelium album PN500]EFA79476.1 putative mitochondrial protein [Heterostelium album PN500]|eukprot:XP_020431597.1 putative mitochondrial protein [Heterostelium album PN500]